MMQEVFKFLHSFTTLSVNALLPLYIIILNIIIPSILD